LNRRLGLPPDSRPSARVREDKLRPGQLWPIEDEVDSGPATLAGEDRRVVDHLPAFIPGSGNLRTVHARGPRPCISRLEDNTTIDREIHEVGQPTVMIRVTSHAEACTHGPIFYYQAPAPEHEMGRLVLTRSERQVPNP